MTFLAFCFYRRAVWYSASVKLSKSSSGIVSFYHPGYLQLERELKRKLSVSHMTRTIVIIWKDENGKITEIDEVRERTKV